MSTERGGGPAFGPEIEQIPAEEKREISGSKSTITPDLAQTMARISRELEMSDEKRWVEKGLVAAEKWAQRSTDPRIVKIGSPQEYIKLYRYLNILQKTGTTIPNRKELSQMNLETANTTRRNVESNRQTERRKSNKLKFLNRPPQLDPEQSTHISNTVIGLLKKTEGDPKKASLEDLEKIVNADKSDALVQFDSFERLNVAMKAASRFLIDREYQKEVRVSISQNNKGKWIAEPFVRPGRLQYTFTAEKIINLKRQLDFYARNLNRLEKAHGAIVNIINGEYIDETEDSVRMLYTYIRAKKNEFNNSAKDSENSPVVKEAAERCFALFTGFQEEVNAYFSNYTDE